MAKSLVIVESPAKARTINRYLGSDFVVKSSVGHIRDLPSGGRAVDPKARAKAAAKTRKLSPAQKEKQRKLRARKQLVTRMGVDPDREWAATYEILPKKEKTVEELRKAAESADLIYLATDLDREGEAIAWHLREVIGGDASRYRRVVFNEITKRAIEEAFESPGVIDQNQVNAQQARRFLDRVVGFELSPLLWARVARGLSAGRVQSVAVRLIVEREREIRAFVPEEYWEVFANLLAASAAADSEPVRFQVVRQAGNNFRPTSEEQTDVALAALKAADYEVTNREDRQTSTRPGAPYITSTLQQAASTRLGFSVRKTMGLAQALYEAGHITYMRTDSTNLSSEALEGCRGYIESNFGDRYLPEKPVVYSSKEGAQEAHEAIRPSNVDVAMRADEPPEQLASMERDAQRLYGLIWRQFVACQMPRAEYTSSTMTVTAGDFELRIRGRILRFDGHTRVQPPMSRNDDDGPLPDIAVGEALSLAELLPKQHFTKPPPRYGEASLVRELEKRGIGRPSTYAAIISTVQDRGYVSLRNRRFYAERIGELVTDRLVECFDNLMDYGFTARMENELDDIAKGGRVWKQVLDDFYGDFSDKLGAAGDKDGEHVMRPNEPTTTDMPCAKCGRPMQIRTGSTGVFLGCSGYSLPPKERCTSTMNLLPGDEAEAVGEEDEARALLQKRKCPRCGTVMDAYLVDEARKLHVCGNNPDCGGFEVEAGEFRIKGYDGPVIECEKCGQEMQLKSGRFGRYFGCTNEDCKNTRKLLRNGQAAPPRADPVPMPELQCVKVDDTYVLRDGAAGLFLAASQFPKHRETRAPKVLELLPHGNELDPKFAYLLEAPTHDPDGNEAILKFARKTNEQYVGTEVDGKATKWRASYRDGRWEQTATDPTPKKKPARKKAAAKKKPAKKRTTEDAD